MAGSVVSGFRARDRNLFCGAKQQFLAGIDRLKHAENVQTPDGN